MKSGLVGAVMVASALMLTLSAMPSRAADEVALERGGVRVETLPVISVRITNETDDTLSLSVTSAACTPRLFLPPRSSITVDDCLRWGLVYQVVAVFYDQQTVHGRRFRLLPVAPGQDWIFRSRSESGPAAAARVRP